MAHQWLVGQVDGANVQGSTMIVETLAQYSALMLTRQKYGDKKLRGILRYELDRYLRGRTNELVEELPLMRVENQSYIHYRKGSVSVMALVDLLGEERMNQALRGFLSKFKFSQDPYPTTLDLKSFIAQGATQSESDFINSIFEQISLYDLRATEVVVEALDNGQFEVTLTIDAHRVNADGQGQETQVALSEMIDIGLFMTDPDDLSAGGQGTAAEKPLYLQKHLISDGQNIIKLVVSERPLFAGIDPFVKLIDRDNTDNIIGL
jgi:ABC-2 type transport system permease protein